MLDKTQARAYVEQVFTRQQGHYNPAKYVLGGWLMEKHEDVLRSLILKAHKEKVASRKFRQEIYMSKTGRYLRKHELTSIHGIDKATGMHNSYLNSPRWTLYIPELMVIHDGVFIRTNCKLNDGHPVIVDAAEALQRFQERRLP